MRSPRCRRPLTTALATPSRFLYFGFFFRLSHLFVDVEASNADWNIGNEPFQSVGGGAGGDSKEACERRGGVWTGRFQGGGAAVYRGDDQLLYPTWVVQLLFLLVFLLSGILFTTLYLVWLFFRRKQFRCV